MSFSFPWVLLFLALTPLWLRKRHRRAIVLSSLAGWRGAAAPRRARWLAALRLLRAATFALLIIAMAGPRTDRHITEEVRQGLAIEMLLDISSSMDLSITGGTNAPASRMEAAKEVVETFIENRPDDLIGLVTFARYADTLSPLTFGHNALVQIVQSVEIQDRPNEDGTAYGDALALACAHLDQMSSWSQHEDSTQADPLDAIQSKIIILLTDGENNCGLHLPEEAAGLAKKWGLRVYAISLGEADEIEMLTDAEQLLEKLSEATGGAYWKIADTDALTEAYTKIDELEKSEIKSATLMHTEYASIFTLFALPALLLLMLERMLNATILRVTEEETP
ncbi:MAG: VWA domain-containing protein [Verrucomicrobia bacterium]|nr:VWA domain-containing protein [Verrucomicrobiota bacterium]